MEGGNLIKIYRKPTCKYNVFPCTIYANYKLIIINGINDIAELHSIHMGNKLKRCSKNYCCELVIFVQ